MEHELIAVLSIVDGALGARVKEFWQILEEQYGASEVRIFDQPTLTLQGGRISAQNLAILQANFTRFGEKVRPYPIRVRQLGHIGDHSLYLQV